VRRDALFDLDGRGRQRAPGFTEEARTELADGSADVVMVVTLELLPSNLGVMGSWYRRAPRPQGSAHGWIVWYGVGIEPIGRAFGWPGMPRDIVAGRRPL
jgi:hypothetical protein